eukprot:RCo017479
MGDGVEWVPSPQSERLQLPQHQLGVGSEGAFLQGRLHEMVLSQQQQKLLALRARWASSSTHLLPWAPTPIPKLPQRLPEMSSPLLRHWRQSWRSTQFFLEWKMPAPQQKFPQQ